MSGRSHFSWYRPERRTRRSTRSSRGRRSRRGVRPARPGLRSCRRSHLRRRRWCHPFQRRRNFSPLWGLSDASLRMRPRRRTPGPGSTDRCRRQPWLSGLELRRRPRGAALARSPVGSRLAGIPSRCWPVIAKNRPQGPAGRPRYRRSRRRPFYGRSRHGGVHPLLDACPGGADLGVGVGSPGRARRRSRASTRRSGSRQLSRSTPTMPSECSKARMGPSRPATWLYLERPRMSSSEPGLSSWRPSGHRVSRASSPASAGPCGAPGGRRRTACLL